MLASLIDPVLEPDAARRALPLHAVRASRFAEWALGLPAPAQAWIKAQGLEAPPDSPLLLPDSEGAVLGAVVALPEADPAPGMDPEGPLVFARASAQLPPGVYRLDAPDLPAGWATDVALSWALAHYRFDRYRPLTRSAERRPKTRLAWPEGADRALVASLLDATALVRDLVNTPAEDLGPADLARAAEHTAQRFGARVDVLVGDAVREAGYPLIHAVGRASPRPPHLIDLTWGNPAHPAVTLVGKGVCFDTGGLDLKTASGMRLMKKDMGGAAHVLALARMVMAADLPVRLRVLIPAVDNVVAGNALRPGDVVVSRKGLSVEIGNTDAEGRLILADALAEASASAPALLLDCATLTGAARVALGPDLPALFTDDEALASHLLAAAHAQRDPLWRLPLWRPYRPLLDSALADLNNAPESPFAGAITAALFLKAFVNPGVRWAHLDLYAWRPSSRPGHPEGGAAQGLRALFSVLKNHIASDTLP
ncbi:leucyl aminopeptidase family protein [Pararhodospirillum oryzae]|uniref:Leucyl aminopeptidase n=1 Tax=Pararhodospirillum oryzae TaxID=478448 RepID=A0A512HBL5_9PROT|nr:leucyl aminopeptidase family protein [Pararhodospirillum oryzae]GEO82832.1 leucyl aminopeptidase [Pararhodospirillum oryzae]